MPFASVVFPAPRFPISNTAPGASPGAISRPSAMVSSSDRVWNVCDGMNALGEAIEQIGRDDGLLGGPTRGDLSREPVQIDRGRNGSIGIVRELSHQAADHAGQNVAGAAGRHGGRARRVNPDAPVGKTNQGAL